MGSQLRLARSGRVALESKARGDLVDQAADRVVLEMRRPARDRRRPSPAPPADSRSPSAARTERARRPAARPTPTRRGAPCASCGRTGSTNSKAGSSLVSTAAARARRPACARGEGEVNRNSDALRNASCQASTMCWATTYSSGTALDHAIASSRTRASVAREARGHQPEADARATSRRQSGRRSRAPTDCRRDAHRGVEYQEHDRRRTGGDRSRDRLAARKQPKSGPSSSSNQAGMP